MHRNGEKMKTETITFDYFVKKEQEGTYFPLAFQVPAEVESLTITYTYPRYTTLKQSDGTTKKEERNLIDFALSGPDQVYIGSYGADRHDIANCEHSITICEYGSSQGFASFDTIPGEWTIVIGACKVQTEGVLVTYQVEFEKKELRLFKGDTHLHTLGSDGTLSVSEIAKQGLRQELDYVIITDHNNYAQNFEQINAEGITVIPGTEWSHYKGHIGMLGVKKPFENAFCVNTTEEAKKKVAEAKENGALIVLEHPFSPQGGFSFGIAGFRYDMVEIWNGGVLPASIKIGLLWWDAELRAGKKVSVVGGSDFHKTELLRMIASPCTNVYAKSRTKNDLLLALKNGNTYITSSPAGPDLFVDAEGAILGEEVPVGTKISIRFWNLKMKDRILFLTERHTEELHCAENVTELEVTRTPANTKFFRIEVYRSPYPGVGEEIALISNPIYIKS